MISLYRYSLPFHSPFQTGERVWSERTGCLLHYRDERMEALTEIAPLPGFSNESLDEVLCQLINHRRVIDDLLSGVSRREEFRLRLRRMNLPPSAGFGISAAWISLTARRAGISIQDWFDTLLNPEIRVNTTLGIEHGKELLTQIESRSDEGFQVIKIKCGRDPANLPGLLKTAADRHPGLTFRIDANQSWELHHASNILNRFTGLPIEYCEEPSLWSSESEFRELKRASPVPLALDESVCSPARLKSALRGRLADCYIIKPMLFGSIFDLLEALCNGKQIVNDPQIIFSSSFESAVGRSITTWLAGMAGGWKRAHGLDTGRVFQKDLAELPPAGAVIRPEPAQHWEIPLETCNRDLITPIQQNGT
ncbi:MAG: o-succinylbenzoate synthase [Balneolaceae bacterium]